MELCRYRNQGGKWFHSQGDIKNNKNITMYDYGGDDYFQESARSRRKRERRNNNDEEGTKTLVAFIVGLLIGGMLVWAFSGPSAEIDTAARLDISEEPVMTPEQKCYDLNGVPILDSYGKLLDCKGI